MKNKEIFYINYMKFLGIIYLLIWHTGIQKINIFVIQFFLQMFIFISGYFYKEEYSEKPFTFIKKRISSLYIPYIFYCSIFLILNNIFVSFSIYKENMYINPAKFGHHFLQILFFHQTQQMAGAMWFVASLFSVSILFLLMSKISITMTSVGGPFKEHEYSRFFLIISLYLFGNYLAYLKCKLPLLIDISFVLLVFYYLGYLFKRHEHKIPLNVFFALSSLLTLLLCMKFGFPQIIQRKYVNPSFILLCGVAGIYLNIYVASKCPTNTKIMKFINYAGRNTMVILALHFLSFKAVSLFIIYSQNLPLNLLSSFPVMKTSSQYYRWMYVVSGLLIPLSVVYLYDTVLLKFNSLMRGRRTEQII